VAQLLIHLPVSHGGLGLSLATMTSHAAFLGSATTALEDVLSLHGGSFQEFSNSPFYSRVASCFDHLRETHPRFPNDKGTPSTAAEWFNAIHPESGPAIAVAGFQRVITREVNGLSLRVAFSAHSRSECAHMAAVACNHAGAWLSPMALKCRLRFSDRDFRCALRHRLGLTPYERALNCICTSGQIAFLRDPSHLHSCLAIRGGQCRRHQLLCQAVVDVARRAGFTCNLEPHIGIMCDDLSEEPVGRTDIEFIAPDGPSIHVDVSVVHPCALSYLATAGKSPGEISGQVRVREARKVNAYSDSVQQLGAEFYAFVVESHGGFGSRAEKLLELLAARASSDGLVSTSDFLCWARVKLAVALQIGNAHVAVCGIHRIRRVVCPRDIHFA
jgi:hypothetical protein